MLDERIQMNIVHESVIYSDIVQLLRYDPSVYEIYNGITVCDISHMSITIEDMIAIYFNTYFIQGWFYEVGFILDIHYNEQLLDYLSKFYMSIDTLYKLYSVDSNIIAKHRVNGDIVINCTRVGDSPILKVTIYA